MPRNLGGGLPEAEARRWVLSLCGLRGGASRGRAPVHGGQAADSVPSGFLRSVLVVVGEA